MIRRKIRGYLKRLLALNDTPERIALAFAVGVFLSFSPLLGLHTILGICIAFLFGLNRVAILMGLFVNNPWTLVPIYALATYLGGVLIGFPAASPLNGLPWSQLWSSGFWSQIFRHWPWILPMFLGSTILAFLCAAIAYPLALFIVRHGRGPAVQIGSVRPH